MSQRHQTGARPALNPLEVVNRPVTALRPDPRNPRKHTRSQVRQIANSIEAFGFSVPILVDGSGQVIAGHGRLAACQLLGWQEVPTIALAHLSADQARALMLADNRLTDASTWDDQLLAQTLLELSNANLQFSIEATGFDMGEIDWRITGLSEPAEENDQADQVPPVAATAVSRMGDLWIIGEHRLICGDALSSATYESLLVGQRVRMVFTDPPYNVPIDGHVSGLGAIKHREFAMATGEMTATQFTSFLETALRPATSRLVDGGMAFVCMDWRHMSELLAATATLGGEIKNLCVWVKHNAGMGSLYRSGHELVLVTKFGDGPHVNNVELGRHGRHRSNVWRYPGANSPGMRHGKEGDLLALHPTPKPVALVADAILDCSHRQDAVLDPFMGSGTTMVAAQRVGRRCYGIELDPLYVDTAIRRVELLTGLAAHHATTGELFRDRAKAAGGVTGSKP